MNRFVSRRVGLSWIILAVVAAAAKGQAPAAPWANKLFLPEIMKNPGQEPPPAITHDFGTVPQGTVCVHKFPLTNIYDVPMQVIDVRKSCGCLEAYPPQKVLQPGETAEFVVSMNTAKFTGANTQTLYVTLGPNYVSTAILKLQATSRGDVQLNPGSVNFGTVAQGSRLSQTVILEYNGRQRDWKVTGVVPSPAPFRVEIKDISGRTWFSSTKYSITVTLNPEAPAGPISETIRLTTTDPASPVVQFNVHGMIEAPLALSSHRIHFDRVKVGTEVTQKVVIRAAAGPFRIESVADAGDGLAVETFPAPAPVQIVTVKFRPTQPGAIRREIRLLTDLGGATATLLVEGEGVTE
jgi:hypothetical protein